MANYKVNEKSKTIAVFGELTAIETAIISTYIKSGYKVREKRKSDKRLNDEDIKTYFNKVKDEKGLEKYEEQKEIKKADKNGKMRKAGFLGASKWFRENYKEAYEEITESKKTNKK